MPGAYLVYDTSSRDEGRVGHATIPSLHTSGMKPIIDGDGHILCSALRFRYCACLSTKFGKYIPGGDSLTMMAAFVSISPDKINHIILFYFRLVQNKQNSRINFQPRQPGSWFRHMCSKHQWKLQLQLARNLPGYLQIIASFGSVRSNRRFEKPRRWAFFHAVSCWVQTS